MNYERRLAKFKKEQENWNRQKQLLIQKTQIEEEKENIIKKKKSKSMSKILIWFLFLNCTIIEIFTGYITLIDLELAKMGGTLDFTPIVTLIGAVVGEITAFAIYSAKASKENSQGGIIYDLAMRKYNKQSTQDEPCG